MSNRAQIDDDSLDSLDSLSDPLLGVANAATVCGVSRRTMDAWIDKDKAPPFFFLGSRRYVRASALREWIAAKQRRAIDINERVATLRPRAETRAA